MIALGGTEITKAYLGNTEISKMYLGEELVFGSNGPVPIEYIEAVSGNKIVTDIYFDENTVFTSVFSFGNISSRTLFCGIYGDRNDGYWATTSAGYVETKGSTASSFNVSNNGTHTFVRGFQGDIKTVDGTSIEKTTTAYKGWFQQPSYPLSIFTYQYNKNGSCNGVRFHSATVEKNGVVTNSLIPIKLNNVGYVYDTVTDTLYANSGTGNFILGSNI